MKTRSFLSVVCACLLASVSHAQLQRIVLQGTGAPQVFTDLTIALAAAQPNDKLYFSGGSFVAPDGFTLNIPLHFIGAGIRPDSTNVTGATTITTANVVARFILTTGAGGSSFTGIDFDPATEFRYGNSLSDDDPVNVVFERCSFQTQLFSLGFEASAGSSSSSSFNECVFFGRLNGFGGAATIDRCVFGPNSYSVQGFSPSGLIMRNSVLLNGLIANCDNALVQNCILTSTINPPFYGGTGTQVANCMISYSSMFSDATGNVEINTIYDQLSTDIFVSETDNIYQFTDDLHLLPASPGNNAGNDGTDMGIYGTPSPSKPGNVPYNPHFRAAAIATSTNANGDLPVNIRVAAQPN
jgi:hypothetical protein